MTTVAALAATAVLLAGCGGSNEATGSSDGTTPTDGPNIELTVPAARAGRCMPPSVENLQARDTAFEGIVEEVSDGTATLLVPDGYKGVTTGTVTVSAPSQNLRDLLLAVDFEEGETYLVSSLDGRVSVCGLSGPRDDLLADLYQRAYRG
ncbi:hypothetical protein [Nocardioides sp. B-3]|uniref:hypothetical protein n=1 Tax=Nocardioides sp. B-3 TaxID=2895565 RepID=UPI002152616C|nr:hypothetical protein [Nocardioides sp. B-3]UUZ57786.1 hypothetical protein LP418_15385 [Nocardioides sp. B-3]